MRIAYIAPYCGRRLLESRPTLLNLALAANAKIELIAELLKRNGHEIEILSQGEVVERQCRFFPAFCETTSPPADIPVFYCSSLPVRFINGAWSSRGLCRLFRRRHQVAPFELVLVYNLKLPQLTCALDAHRRMKLPVMVEYEDDALVDLGGKVEMGFRAARYSKKVRSVLDSASGCIGVSPHLLSRFPASIPSLLLRGVVHEDVLAAGQRPVTQRQNWVVYSGTHYRSKGLEPLVAAWKELQQPDWELHITGRGELTESLKMLARDTKSIVFHGLLERPDNARLLGNAKIGMNPHDLSHTPGNVFAFKIIEYLAAGTHVITTPMGELEPSLERGITYMPDNSPETIAATLARVIKDEEYARTAPVAAGERYGPAAVAQSLDTLTKSVMAAHAAAHRRSDVSTV